jgi:hypothetical protein
MDASIKIKNLEVGRDNSPFIVHLDVHLPSTLTRLLLLGYKKEGGSHGDRSEVVDVDR